MKENSPECNSGEFFMPVCRDECHEMVCDMVKRYEVDLNETVKMMNVSVFFEERKTEGGDVSKMTASEWTNRCRNFCKTKQSLIETVRNIDEWGKTWYSITIQL